MTPTSIPGEQLAAITREMVRIKSQDYGKGATEAKTYQCDNFVFCVLKDALTTVERNLLEHGDAALVREVRLRFQHHTGNTLPAVVERITGRRVLGRRPSRCRPTSSAGGALAHTWMRSNVTSGRPSSRRPGARRRRHDHQRDAGVVCGCAATGCCGAPGARVGLAELPAAVRRRSVSSTSRARAAVDLKHLAALTPARRLPSLASGLRPATELQTVTASDAPSRTDRAEP
jgi:uncharacterized protein YbcI